MRNPRRSLSSTSLIRSFNAISVLRTIYREGECSKARIAEVTRMSPPTVTRIMANLVAQGIVTEHTVAESTGGRKPVIFTLSYNRLYVAGIQLARDRVAMGICDIRGEILRRRVFTPYSLDPDELIVELTREFNLMLESSEIGREQLLGVGLAVSGLVDSATGVLRRSVNLGWRDVPIADVMESVLGLPVKAENDANAAAMGELWLGCAGDTPNFMYLKTDTGVGAGIICDGAIMDGARGMAGEIGHSPIIGGGRECVCGQRGCLETYLYAPRLLRRYESESGKHIDTTDRFFAFALQGDAVARAMVEEARLALTRTLSVCATLLDLELMVIGGIWGQFDESFCQAIENSCNSVLEMSGLAKTVLVRGSALNDNSDILGAAAAVINSWFTPPI